MKDGPLLRKRMDEFDLGEGIKLITRNRKSRRNRTAGGGVAIVYDSNRIQLDEKKIRKGSSEIVCAVGRVNSMSRKIVIFVVYIPPRMRAAGLKEFTVILRDRIKKAKDDHNDPAIIVGGDVNNFDITKGLEDYQDICFVNDLCTRDGVSLDKVVSNLNDQITTAVTRDPLVTEDGRASDHRIILIRMSLVNHARFKKIKYTVRPQTKKGDAMFGEWIDGVDWREVLVGSAEKDAETFTEMISNTIGIRRR